MNKILYTLISICCMTLASCSDFLDIVPTGEVIPETTEEYRALLLKAYESLPRDRGLTSFRSDEVNIELADAQSKDSYKDIWIWNDVNPSNHTMVFEWVKFYYTIYISNQVIENELAMKGGTSLERNQLVGEAYLLRAYTHFLLVNLYANHFEKNSADTEKGIPLKLNTNMDEVLKRNTVAEVYDSVLKDIDESHERLNIETWETKYLYRFNMLSAEAFKSRVYLYMGKWSDALLASEKVLERNDKLVNLSNNNEFLPNHYKSQEIIAATEQVITSSYVQAIYINKQLIDLHKAGDLRKSKYYKAITASIYNLIKGGSKEFHCSFRTGEIYLNAAEAALKTDDITKAKKYLLTLLQNRYRPDNFEAIKNEVEALSINDFEKYLYDERFKELAFEGHRWFDLRRTTQPRLEKEYQGNTYILEQNDVRYTIRIPQDAINNNPNLSN